MSYESYLENELIHNPQYKELENEVKLLLDVVSGQGHSGCSMSFFGPSYLAYAESPVPITDDGNLLKPIWEVVRHLTIQKQKAILKIASRISCYIPLSPIMGGDDEWIIHGYDDRCYAQNKRKYNIFKNKQGQAYWADGIIFHEPTIDYSDFIGLVGSGSAVNIEFPFDPDTEPKRLYYKDEDRLLPIENQDPYEWLKEAKERFHKGFDPITGQWVKDAWVMSLHEARALIDLYYDLTPILKQLDQDSKDTFISDLIYYYPRSKNYRVTIDVKKAVPPISTFSINSGMLTLDQGNLTLTTDSYPIVRNLIRLLVEMNDDPTLTISEVQEPSKHYQIWLHVNKYTITSRTDILKGYPIMFVDGDKLITTDPHKYLYQKCKELNLEYKGSKK